MDNHHPHLLIEEGPEKGREISIPAKGARIGRAEENDISIADAAMSRFQCRMYFRDDFLYIMDLGSTNETLVNHEAVSDTPLRFGDEILIGDTLIKVINDGLHEKTGNRAAPASVTPPEKASEPPPAPIIFNMGDDTPAAESTPPPPPPPEHRSSSQVDVDLGLGRREDLEAAKEKGSHSSGLSLLLVTLVTMLIVFGAGFLIMIKTAPPPVEVVLEDKSLQYTYEKVIAGNGNIFRYALQLDANGALTAEVHDLRQQRSIVRKEKVDPERLTSLRDRLMGNRDSLLALQDEYEGLPIDSHESFNLTVIFGKDAKTVRVANQLEPDAFKQVRQQIEAFSNNELGLINPDIPPEELRRLAAESWENAQSLYAARDVKNGNLWEATQKLKDVVFLLETIEPKPTYYKDAITLREQWRRDLLEKVANLEFEAIRAHTMGDPARSMELNRRILATFPEKSHTEYKDAYNRLTLIEQEMNR